MRGILLLFAVGAGIAIVLNNLLLVPVLAMGMMFLPFWYIKLTAGHYKKDIAAELETALSIITTLTSAVRICRPPWRRISTT